MKNKQVFVDVILPLSVEGTFTYTSITSVRVGQRVIVQFGTRKLYSAIVCRIHNNSPKNYVAKEVLAVIDEKPIVNIKQLEFWQWISDYYMCNLGEVMNAALPSSFKLASESKIIIHPDFDGDLDHLKENEIYLINVLSNKETLKISEVSKLIQVKSIFSFINTMISKEIVQIKEDLYDKYKEKKVRIVKFIGSDYLFKETKLTVKQKSFIDAYLNLKELFPRKQYKVSALLKETGYNRGILNALIQKNILAIEEHSISRLLKLPTLQIKAKELADFQQKALDEIRVSLIEKDVCLLHGVTSSGKTELYIKLIQEQLDKGKQILYLLPEIALSTQIINRLRKHFGDKVGVTHSHLNNSERIEVWKAVQEKVNNGIQYSIILGARSSLFLPFGNLGLIIIDEEHDPSFKQHQPSPRYHARDSAIYLASLHKAKVLLGSATPSVESYYNAKKKKYSLVNMKSRFADIQMPEIQTIDMRKAYLKKQMIHQFTPNMLSGIKQVLGAGKQIILFQNRRGYSPVMSCGTCAFTAKCDSCDVSLTYHKWNNQLKCHYCGSAKTVPDTCPSCSSNDFRDKGFGTEQIEESLRILFPDFVTKRMDYDTTRGKNAHQRIITDFEQGRTDILVGTQMVTKGLDFDNVGLVGILNADSMLYFPDFRAYERAFQLMMQVSGRAGRKGEQGKVLIQTYDITHEIFDLLKSNDYLIFIKKQIEERRLFNYPPYNRIIAITLKHKKQRKLDIAADILFVLLRKSFGNRVLGPEYPAISRIRNYYHKNILLKIEQEGSHTEAKNILQNIMMRIKKHADFKAIRIIVDIDPV